MSSKGGRSRGGGTSRGGSSTQIRTMVVREKPVVIKEKQGQRKKPGQKPIGLQIRPMVVRNKPQSNNRERAPNVKRDKLVH